MYEPYLTMAVPARMRLLSQRLGCSDEIHQLLGSAVSGRRRGAKAIFQRHDVARDSKKVPRYRRVEPLATTG
jgi:hypothetical protein